MTAGPPPAIDRPHLLIRGATILSMDPDVGDLVAGDIEIVDGAIAAVGAGLAAPGAEVIDGRGRIVVPGFVDPHWHLWGTLLRGVIGDGHETGYFAQKNRYAHLFRPEDTAAAVRLGAADGLLAGITTIHDWAHNVLSRDDAEADLGALRELGVRARFSYGAPSSTPGLSLDQMAAALGPGVAVGVDEAMDIELAASLRSDQAGEDLLTFGVALRGPARSTIDVVRTEFAAARSHGLPIAMHCAGTRAEVERIDQVAVLDEAGLLGDDLLLAHANHLPAPSVERLAAHDIPVTVSPATELRLAMGRPPVGRLRSAGIRVSLSLDSTAISGAADPFDAMRLAAGIERIDGDVHALTAREVLAMATLEGARTLGLGDRVGSIRPGKRADLVLVATDRPGLAPVVDPYVAIVHGARPSDVRTVLVDGRRVVDEGRLLTAEVDEIVATATAALAALRQRAGDRLEERPR
jgi:5-methylthioadenosine/S-adenosylhomocysteine deaminase